MASLKEIMNVDEDERETSSLKKGRESVPRSSIAPDSISVPSRYGSSTESSHSPLPQEPHSTSLLTRPSQHLAHDSFTYSTSSSPRLSAPGSPRRSSNSTDSMDPSFYSHAHGYPLGSSGSSPNASRSYMNQTPVNDAGVKLTPITGRVSRAKKGVPVHICEICQKTFTRAEHLRRHQLSHQPAELHCTVPGCDKSFHRKDLLERHQMRHEQEYHAQAKASDGHLSGGHGSSYLSDPQGQGYRTQPPTIGRPFTTQLGYGASHTDVSLGPTDWPSVDGGGAYTGDRDVPSHHGSADGDYRMGPAYGDTSSGFTTQYGDSTANSQWQNANAMVSSLPVSNVHHPTSNGVRPAGTSVGWEDASSFMFEQHGVTSPAAEDGLYSYTSSPPQAAAAAHIYDASALGLPLGGFSGQGAITQPVPLLPDNIVRSLTPPLAVAQKSETLVTTPTAVPSSTIAASTSQHMACARQPENLVGLFANAAATAAAAPPALSRRARDALPTYLDVYWDKIPALYPVIHKEMMEDTGSMSPEERDALQCSLGAIATQFLQDESHRINGHELHVYSWNLCKKLTSSPIWSLPAMQAVLSCEYYARFRGRNKQAHRPSARFGKLYQMTVNHQIDSLQRSSSSEAESSWEEWVKAESYRRLLTACFLVDAHSMIYYEQAPIVIRNMDYSTPHTLRIPLVTGNQKLWEAPDRETFAGLYPFAGPPETVQSIMAKTLSASDLCHMHPSDKAVMYIISTLRLPRRKDIIKPDVGQKEEMSPEVLAMSNLFGSSGIANAYLALHHTPLHILLSVTGDSWVFNKKVARPAVFSEHKRYLREWSESTNALHAVVFAARALRAFLHVTAFCTYDTGAFVDQSRGRLWCNLSDYWGVYVCALICWAFGQRRDKKAQDASRRTGLEWILTASRKEPEEIGRWTKGGDTLAVVCLVRDVLSRDLMGARNILLADSVNVLRRLASKTGRG